MSTLITLVRHGHTAWNGLGRYQGHAPTPLSERGHEQARYLALALADDGPFSGIHSSDLLRCRQTVGPLVEMLGLPVKLDARLREVNYGNWQGLTRAELAELDGERFEAYQSEPYTNSIPGGENLAMLADRVCAALSDVVTAHPDGYVLIVSHGGPIREILRHFELWEGGSPAGNASRTVLEVSGPNGPAVLRTANDVTHLPPNLRPDANGTGFITLR